MMCAITGLYSCGDNSSPPPPLASTITITDPEPSTNKIEGDVAIVSHKSGDIVGEQFVMAGSATSGISRIEVSVGVDNYQVATGTANWSFSVDTSPMAVDSTALFVRGWDATGVVVSEEVITVIVNRTPDNIWQPERLGSRPIGLWSVWGTDTGSVFAAGLTLNSELPVVLDFDGNDWQMLPDAGTNFMSYPDIWGTDKDNFYIVSATIGLDGQILHHHDGNSATELVGNFSAVWGSGSNDVFAVGSYGIAHFDGDTWSALDTGFSGYQFADVSGSASDDVYVVGNKDMVNTVVLHFDGATWTDAIKDSSFSSSYYNHIWVDAGNVYVAGGGRILQFNGIDWHDLALPFFAPSIQGVWSNGGHLYVISNVNYESGIYHFDGSQWLVDKEFVGLSLTGIWGSKATGAYVVGVVEMYSPQQQAVIFKLPSNLVPTEPNLSSGGGRQYCILLAGYVCPPLY